MTRMNSAGALGAKEAEAQAQAWDMTADVVIAGAGISGLSAAIEARDRGASVIIVEENYDCGGHGLVSGGNVNLGGGTTRQRTLRALLREAMTAQGFEVYPEEWWHFDYKDWRRYGIGTRSFTELAGG